jgi:NADH-quinone oxidoreductase subunit N
VKFDDLVQKFVDDMGPSLGAFRPELVLCATIVALLLARIIAPRWTQSAFWLTLSGLCVAGCLAFPWQWRSAPIPGPMQIFTGTLLSDSFTVVMRGILLLFGILLSVFTWIGAQHRKTYVERSDIGANARREPYDRRGDMTEFYVLMLGALVGMCLMVSANHILIVVLGVEMASVPCYVLAAMRWDRPNASEAALKFAVFGAAATGIMLYGLSLLAGVLGSAHLPTMGARLAELLQSGAGADRTTVLALGGLMLAVGVAFKLAAVPFHFWLPDVFEGATAYVGVFLSVAANTAALGLLVRLAVAFSFHSNPVLLSALAPARFYIYMLLTLLAAVTCTFGNLAAYGQIYQRSPATGSMKRFLGYTAIAHSGYMVMPVAAAIALVDTNLDDARAAIAAMVFYVVVDLFMNLTAFSTAAFSRRYPSEKEPAENEFCFGYSSRYPGSYRGLMYVSPAGAFCLIIALLSFVGLPPLAGFAAKLAIFLTLIKAKFFLLLFVGILNTVLSLVPCLYILNLMISKPESPDPSPSMLPLWSAAAGFCLLVTVPVVVLFFVPSVLLTWAYAAASALF